MNKITLTLDLTPRNLDLLKAFCDETDATIKVSKSEEEKPKTKKTTKKAAAKATEEALAPEPVKEEKKESISLTDVRAVALKLSKAGKQDALKEAFAIFGAKKLSDVKPEDYPALMEELKAITAEGL